jgi:hypothetical protein
MSIVRYRGLPKLQPQLGVKKRNSWAFSLQVRAMQVSVELGLGGAFLNPPMQPRQQPSKQVTMVTAQDC